MGVEASGRAGSWPDAVSGTARVRESVQQMPRVAARSRVRVGTRLVRCDVSDVCDVRDISGRKPLRDWFG